MKKGHLLIGIIIIVFSLYYAFKNVSLSELGMALISVNYAYLLPAVLMVVMSYILRAIRWRYLISSVKDVRVVSIFSPLMVGFMANMLPARAGEFIRAYLLGKKENISFSASFATIFIERLFDMSLVLFLLFIVLFFRGEIFSTTNSEANHRLIGYMIKFGWVSLIGVIFILIFSLFLQYRNEWAMKIVHIIIRPLPERWGYNIISMVQSFTNGLSVIKNKKGFLVTVILSFLIWTNFVALYYPLYLAFDIQTRVPLIPSLLVLNLTIAIFITLFPTPGFLGAFQAACVVALHEIFMVPKVTAASYGIVAWLVTMGTTIAVGTIFVIKDNISLKQLTTDSERVKQP
ncbi:MAG: lysylphosphatidylglycerol synthase transmembrane domain-containing protein [Thermodesulfovibrionia bacterium]